MITHERLNEIVDKGEYVFYGWPQKLVAEEAVTMADEIIKLRADNERWRKNSIETWEAMQTMRNQINEHIPMPSLESDLLRGPENSIFCAAVAEAVISHLLIDRID